jgi:hypothetical protein
MLMALRSTRLNGDTEVFVELLYKVVITSQQTPFVALLKYIQKPHE